MRALLDLRVWEKAAEWSLLTAREAYFAVAGPQLQAPGQATRFRLPSDSPVISAVFYLLSLDLPIVNHAPYADIAIQDAPI